VAQPELSRREQAPPNFGFSTEDFGFVMVHRAFAKVFLSFQKSFFQTTPLT